MSWQSSTWKKSPGWDAKAAKVKRRAGYRCEHRDPETGRRCINGNGVNGEGLDADHIVPKDAGGSDDLDNLRALCHEHHVQATTGYRNAKRKARRERFRRTEDHPGML